MSYSDNPQRSLWSNVRGVLIALHVAAVVIGAFPAPVGGLDKAAWSEPTVQAELDTWHGLLQGGGLQSDRAEFEADLYRLAGMWVRSRKHVVKPFQPYYRYLGVEQSWRMFVAPHKHPSRLQVQVRSGESDAWETLFEQDNPDYSWRSHQLLHTRMRSCLFRYSWPGYRKNFKALSRWVGREVSQERPDASHVRLQWLRRRTAGPAKMRAGDRPPEKVVRPIVVDLAELAQ